MAFWYLRVFVAIFLLVQSTTAFENSSFGNSSFVDSYLDNLCELVQCGKGTCRSSLDYSFNFICECEPGWRQARNDSAGNGFHRFQPCIYPNCTMDYACGEAPPPTPNILDTPKNISLYDPCSWAYCGDGSCTPSGGHGYTCDCRQGYSNLMNITSFPCFSDCVIGSDCTELGVTLSNETVSTPNSDNHGSSVVPRKFLWLMILTVSLALFPLSY